MRKVLDLIPGWIIELVLIVVFCATWPILFVIIGIKNLFGSQSSSAEKIAGAKMAILTIIGIVILSVIVVHERSFRMILDAFPLEIVFGLLITGLFILAMLQKLFPSIKWLQKKSDGT